MWITAYVPFGTFAFQTHLYLDLECFWSQGLWVLFCQEGSLEDLWKDTDSATITDLDSVCGAASGLELMRPNLLHDPEVKLA